MTFYTEIAKPTLKYKWKPKRPWIAKAILNKSPMLELSQHQLQNILQSYNNKNVWYWHKNRQKDQWIRIKDSD
jgi:hypothetical protein